MVMPDRSALELRHLRYFVAVAEELNVSRAARRLNVSQPPLTRQIQQFEEIVGAPLFTRTTRGMVLTEAGKVMLADARNLLALTLEAVDHSRNVAMGRVGRIDVAGFGSLMLGAVPQFLARFRHSHPGIELVLQTLNRPEQVAALRQGRIAAAFIRQGNDPPDIASEPFMREELVAALPAAHPLARRKRIALRDVVQLPFVVQGSGPRPNFTDTLLAMFARAGLRPEVVQNVGDSITAVAVVAGGFGAAMVPRSASHLQLPGVAFVPVSDVTPGIADLACIYRRDDQSPVLQTFISELRAFRKQMRSRTFEHPATS
jgi:DNA-binding transcriptional LysR family regulator